MLYWVLVPLLVGVLLVALLPRRVAPTLALLALATSGGFALRFVREVVAGGTPESFGVLRLDAPGALVLLLVLTLGSLAALVSSQTEQRVRRFYVLLLAFTATMTLATIADNLGILWASIEATTLSSALLVGIRRNQEATEAAWKYVILSTTGITIAFLATLLLALASRDAGAMSLSWTSLMAQAPTLDPNLVRLAFVLALVGYGTKAGLIPLHFWLPDAHSEAPSPVSALLSGVLLSCALLALDRFARIGRAAHFHLDGLLVTFGAVSVLVGGLLVFGARNYKRMLAHHSVENMGLVAFGMGLGTPLAMAGAYLHILTHGLAKSLAFFSAGRIHHHTGSKMVADVHGLLQRTPAAGRGLCIGLLALVGAPLFGPFTSKMMLLSAGVQEGVWVATLAVLLGLLFAFVGALSHIAHMVSPAAETPTPGDPPVREPWSVPVALGILIVGNLVLGLAGPTLLSSLLSGAANLAGGIP